MINERIIEKHIKSIGSRYEDDLMACALSAYKAGRRIAKRDFSQQIVEKSDEHVGHHATIMEADMRAQKIIFREFGRDVLHIGEEADSKNPRFAAYRSQILTASNYLELLPYHKVVIGDSLDGTVQYTNRSGQWSVSVGILDKMKHTAAAVSGPRCNFRETRSGLLVIAAADTPTYMFTNKGVKEARVSSLPANRKDWVVYYGVDTPFLSPPNFLKEYAGNSRVANTDGSCALGLARLATGEGEVRFQPEQRVWDWAAGKLLVERAGGYMLMYEVGKKLREMGRGAFFDVNRAAELELYHYNPAQKPLGFIAACDKRAAEEVFAELQHAYSR